MLIKPLLYHTASDQVFGLPGSDAGHFGQAHRIGSHSTHSRADPYQRAWCAYGSVR